jgi:hypothetical protein
VYANWEAAVVLAGFSTSMAVNALVTGLIVFKILKVFLNVKPTSVERSFGSSGGSTQLRHIIFVIIESGMALFAIQLIRVVFSVLPVFSAEVSNTALNFVIGTHEMFNVIIRSVHFYYFHFTDTIFLARASHPHLFWCESQ